jgi:hypothetical protein
MSITVRCEVCGKNGEVHWLRRGPIGWLVSDVTSQDLITHEVDPEGTLTVFVCSEECSRKFWGEPVGIAFDMEGYQSLSSKCPICDQFRFVHQEQPDVVYCDCSESRPSSSPTGLPNLDKRCL